MANISCSEENNNDLVRPPEDQVDRPEVLYPACDTDQTPLFLEKEGLVRVEIEAVSNTLTSWTYTRLRNDYYGEGYYVWTGPNHVNKPGEGTLTYKIRITNTGTYRFMWRSIITEGSNNTEHNDNWLRIGDAKHFYARNGNSVVYPRDYKQEPLPDSLNYNINEVEGSSKDNWFKVYINELGNFTWSTSTFDYHPHSIYAVFSEPGDYTVEISARSAGYGLDSFVLYNEDVSPNLATGVDTPVSEIQCL